MAWSLSPKSALAVVKTNHRFQPFRVRSSSTVHDNLRNLGVDQLDVVNLGVGGVVETSDETIEVSSDIAETEVTN